jgi:uncharacterized protein
MKRVFIDTAYLIASLSPKDQLRQGAEAAIDELGNAEFITTDLVLVELLNHFSGQGNFLRVQAANFAEELMRDPTIEFILHGKGLLIAALEFYRKRQDKGYSLTDCVSMLVMQDRGITDVLTDDKHFRQEGFVTLL